MRILIYSPAFLPMTGGLENMAFLLAREFGKKGNEVTVITQASQKDFPDSEQIFTIIRKPSLKAYWRTYSSCDVILFLNISLNGIWPLGFKRKIRFVSHQITYFSIDGKLSLLEGIKRWSTRFFNTISCSNYVRSTLPKAKGEVIPNAYDQDLFRCMIPFEERQKDIVFVGRLVSDKGCATLLQALSLLKEHHLYPQLSIIGEGPEMDHLKSLTASSELDQQVRFLGKLTGEVLVNEMNQYRLMVVPSLWKEPFGLVALEGLACGCDVIVSEYGGLKEAIGPFGFSFENGNASHLKEILFNYFTTESLSRRKDLDLHLQKHQAASIAEKYLHLFESKISKSKIS